MTIGYIMRLKNGEPIERVQKHEETLKRLGYTVSISENGVDLVVEGSKIYKGEIDLTDHEVAMKLIKNEIIDDKVLLSYSGGFKVLKKDGCTRVLPGNFALNFLEDLCEGISCLVVKENPSDPPKGSTFSLDDLLAG